MNRQIILAAPENPSPASVDEENERRVFTVDAVLHGLRLDRALALRVPEFSRSYLQQLIADGAVQLNGQTARRASTALSAGQTVGVELRPTPQAQAFRPEDLPVPYVFRDEHLAVIDKPAGLVVHPAAGNWSGTLLNGLLAADPKAAALPRAGIVHRLDKDTSGLMVVARTRAAMDELVRRIAAREVSRHYLALAHRAWRGEPEREVDLPIGRDPRNRLRMAAVDLGLHPGKEARTTIRLLANAEPGCLVECRLHTGRTHQIRVHMAALGHPLVADALYGGTMGEAGMGRQALHAARLGFTHPVTAQALVFESPLPQDLREALADWGIHYNTGSMMS